MNIAAAPRRDAAFALSRELNACQILIGQLKDLCEGDPEFLADSIEGQTNVLELIDLLDKSIVEDEARSTGYESVAKEYAEKKRRADARADRKRALLQNALDMIGLRKHRTSVSTLSLAPVPIKAIVLEEADVPSRFWKTQEPKLDQKALTEHVRERAKALAAAERIDDPDARRAAIETVDSNFPPIPGVAASNGGFSLRRA
jgi:hypothetical protein